MKDFGDWHIASQIGHSDLVNDSTLHVVSVCSNPVRYHSRYRLARKFITAMAGTKNVTLHVVESAFGDRHHELKELCEELGVDFIPIRTRSEIWIKENMVNLGMRNVLVRYPQANYLAWIDADVFFRDPNWAVETVHQLQHFQVVQPWSDCADLGHQGGILQHFKSFGAQHQRRKPKQKHPSEPYEYSHTGFAWACTRDFFEAIGGLMEFPILGSADHHMGFGMIGEVMDTVHGGMSDPFKRMAKEWQSRAIRITKNEVGFVPGRIEHEFHGPKKRRYYRERWQILIDHKFNPDTDIIRDRQGMIQLVGKPALEQAIKLYNRSRYEDSIEEH